MKRQNIYYYVAVVLVVVLLKLGFASVKDDGPALLLSPLAAVIELFTGTKATFHPGTGYYYDQINIIISKSCSGFNFICLSFLLLCFLSLKHITNERKRILVIPVVLTISYAIALIVNTSRILVAVFVNTQITSFSHTPPAWLHVAEGTFIYLFFLIVIYLLTELLFTKQTRHNEKSSPS